MSRILTDPSFLQLAAEGCALRDDGRWAWFYADWWEVGVVYTD